VITPVHPIRVINGKLERAARSVHAQTLLPDAHVIAVDNDREGAAVTRNRALMSARSDWVAFLDSDDMFLPKHLQWLMRHAEETGADFVYSWFKIIQEFADGTTRILEDDPVFPMTHYLDPFDPDNPIETTTTVLARTELAQSVGFQALDRGEVNSGEDRFFTMGCLAAGAKVSHLVRKSWLWSHAWLDGKTMANTSGLPTRGDAVWPAQQRRS
jgi:hypothetical protein